MDYTTHAIRPLIYKDKEDIECFNIDDEKALDAAMLELIEESPIIELDGANGYILELFNNAYYITTLIRMEKRPLLFFRNYITIAEHTGSAYYDVHERNTYYDYFSAFTMAMVCNYLRLLDENYLDEDNQFIKKVTEHFKKFFKPTSSREDAYSVFTANLMSIDVLYSYNTDKKSFVPRKIDEQAINETKAHFRPKYSTWSNMIRGCAFKSNEQFINEVCRTEEERRILANVIRKEESIIPHADIPFSTLGIPHAPVHHINETKQEQHEEEQKNKKELESRIAELEAELKLRDERIAEKDTKIESLKQLLEQKEFRPTKPEEAILKEEIARQKQKREDMLVELLLPSFYMIEADARSFVRKIDNGMDSDGVAEVARQYYLGNKIVKSKRGRSIWEILHAAKLYDKVEQSWTREMRKAD